MQVFLVFLKWSLRQLGFRTKKVGVMAKLLSVLILVLFSQLSSAHGGRLNSEGCHDERKTGGYHCLSSRGGKAAVGLCLLQYPWGYIRR